MLQWASELKCGWGTLDTQNIFLNFNPNNLSMCSSLPICHSGNTPIFTYFGLKSRCTVHVKHCVHKSRNKEYNLAIKVQRCLHWVNLVNRYVSLRLRVQNRRKKWNFPLNFRTMRKLSDLYSGIFQTQSSGCASGVDLFRNFTKLKILNI